jgi:hypothetical protein
MSNSNRNRNELESQAIRGVLPVASRIVVDTLLTDLCCVEHIMSDRYHTRSRSAMQITRARSNAHGTHSGPSPTTNFKDSEAVIIPADPSRQLPRPLQSATNHISNENENFGRRAPRFSPVPFTYEWIMSPDRDRELKDTPSPPPLLPGREMIECANCHDFFDVGAVVAGQGGPGQDCMWELRCGHMLDSKCLNELGCPPSTRKSTSLHLAFFNILTLIICVQMSHLQAHQHCHLGHTQLPEYGGAGLLRHQKFWEPLHGAVL